MIQTTSIKAGKQGHINFPYDLTQELNNFEHAEVVGGLDKQIPLQFQAFYVREEVDGFVTDGVDRRAPYLVKTSTDMSSQAKYINLEDKTYSIQSKNQQ